MYFVTLTSLPTIIFGKDGVPKSKLSVWRKLNKCLNYRETEILWRIQHGAFLTPPPPLRKQWAFQMIVTVTSANPMREPVNTFSDVMV